MVIKHSGKLEKGICIKPLRGPLYEITKKEMKIKPNMINVNLTVAFKFILRTNQ